MREELFSEQDMKYTIIDANRNQIEIGLHDNSDVRFIKVTSTVASKVMSMV